MKLGIRYSLILWSIFFSKIAFCINDPFKIEINLQEVNNHSLHIRIQTPKMNFKRIRFVFPSNVPGCISEQRIGSLVSNLKAYDEDDKEVVVSSFSINESEIDNSSKIRRIEYDIHDTWHSKGFSDMLPQLGTDFEKGEHFLLNFNALIGYVEGYENYAHKLEITKPQSLNSFAGTGLNTYNGVDYIELPSYLALIDNPVMYAKAKERSFLIGNTRYNIGFYSDNEQLSTADVDATIREICQAVNDFCNGLSQREFTFLFNFVDPLRYGIQSEEVYGAVSHSRSTVFFFPSNSSKSRLQRDIQFTSAHELFHLFEPLNIKTEQTYNLNLRAKTGTENLWMYEGFTEYFSLLMLMQKEIITEQEFLTEMRNKINLAQFLEPFSLSKQSQTAYLDGNEKSYKNFYNKGAVMAMMLDLKLLKISKGEMNLQSVMTDLQGSIRKNYILKDNQLVSEIVKYSYPEIQTFFDKYVKDTLTLNYNDYLNLVGYKFQSQKNDTAHLYANANYRYSRNSKEFYATNISLDQIGLRENDVLLKINGKKVTKENIDELLEKSTDLNNKKKVVFTIKRSGKEMELSGQPLTITKNQKNIITINQKTDPETKSYRRAFSSGKIHKRGNTFNILN